MTAAFALEQDDRALDQAALDEARAADLAIVAADRAADRALADRIAAEYVGPEIGWDRRAVVGPTEGWRHLREDPAAWRSRRNRLYANRPLRGLDDVDEIAVERLAAGDLKPRRATPAERALAIARCRDSGLSIAQTAARLGMRPRSVERLQRRARAIDDLRGAA